MRVGQNSIGRERQKSPRKIFAEFLKVHQCAWAHFIPFARNFGAFSRDYLSTHLLATRFHRGRSRLREGLWKGLTIVPRGTVKWFNPTKGYGFIQPQGGGKDVFVHISAVERAGLHSLNEGQPIEFEIAENRGRSSAENLRVSR
jgi:CspA family cold shock protein